MKKILDWFGLPNSKKEEEKARLKKFYMKSMFFFKKSLKKTIEP